MNRSYFDHPSEEALERYLLHHAQEDELDGVETHILACEACVSRLEELEIQMSAVKLALQQLAREPKGERARERSIRKEWVSLRTLSWAGALAVVALTVAVTPRFLERPQPAVDVSLSATRGSGAATVPVGRPLHLHLSAQDISPGAVEVVMVEADGAQVWKGAGQSQADRVDITVPKIDKPGTHYLRLYPVRADHTTGDLLREFVFEVR